MKKTRKITLFVLLLSLVCLLTVCLCACTDGANGTDGKDGANGKSAYEIWLEEGHSGTQADFLDWLKGTNGENGSGTNGEDGKDGKDGVDGLSAYEIFLKYNTDYTGTEAQWIDGLVNNKLIRHTITFKSEVHEDIVKTAFDGLPLLDIPEVPEKEGQARSTWDITNFDTINENMTVNAVYTMQKFTVTFHNEFTDDEDIVFENVTYGEAITEVPEITEKIGNRSTWSITDFSKITSDLYVEAIYETQNLSYKLINQRTQYSVSAGNMDEATQELFIPVEHSNKPVTKIDDFANTALKIVHIPDSIVEIEDNAFQNCTELTSINIPNGVTGLHNSSFYNCTNLTDLFIDMTIIPAYAFIPDSGSGYDVPIENLIIGKHVKEFPMRNYGAVGDVYMLNGILSKNLQYISVAEDNDVFHSVNNSCLIETASKTLVRSTINCNNIPTDGSVTNIGEWAFSGCNFSSFLIPDNITSIGESAFRNCNNLETVIISKNVTTINSNTFCECRNLIDITLPENLLYIKDDAFSVCENLTNISIPSKVEELWISAFNYTNIKTLIIPKNVTKLGVYNVVGGMTIFYEGAETDFSNINFLTYANAFDYELKQTTSLSYGALLDKLEISDIEIYFYSSEPTNDDYYWHYDLDGTTPVIWVKEN